MFDEQSYGHDVEFPYACVVVLYGKTKTTICAAVAIEKTCEQPIIMCLLICCIGYKQVVGSIKRTVGYSRRICPDSTEDDSRTNVPLQWFELLLRFLYCSDDIPGANCINAYRVISIEAPKTRTCSLEIGLRRDISSPIVRPLESVAREKRLVLELLYISYAWTSRVFAMDSIPSLFTQPTCAIIRPCFCLYSYHLLHHRKCHRLARATTAKLYTDRQYSSFKALRHLNPRLAPGVPSHHPAIHHSRDDTSSHSTTHIIQHARLYRASRPAGALRRAADSHP